MADDSEWIALPTLDKCLHKVWKARVAGYEEAMKEFQSLQSTPKDPKFDQYMSNIKKFIIDSNANSQEKGCAAALLFMTHADSAKKVVKEAVSGVVAKGLNGKPKTKEICGQIVLMCVEIEAVTEARDEILEAFSSKQPKVVAAAVNIVTQCLHQFGSKVFPIKPLIQKSILKPVMEHKDGKVRDEGKALVAEMYRWIGDTLSKLLPILELKEVMLKELEEEWSKVEKGVPDRYTRSQQAKLEEEEEEMEEEDGGGGGANAAVAGEDEAAEEVDPYDLVEAADILKILQKNCSDFNTMLTDKSWKVRKEALDALLPLATENLKIVPSSDFGSIVTPLSKIIAKDSNIVVVQLAVKCLGGIAKGLRKGYATYAKETIIACLSKYKEKKVTVVAVLSDCLDAAVDTTQFASISEHVLESLKDKNPAVRQETINFTVRLLQRSKANSLPKTVMKELCPVLKNLLNDTVGPVRDAGAAAIGTAMKVVGEKFMTEYISDLDNIKKQKVMDTYDKAEVKYPFGAAAAAKKSTAASAPKQAPKKAEPKKAEPAKKNAAKKPAAKKGPAKKAAAAAPPPKKENKQKIKDSEDITEQGMTDEQVDEAVEGFLDAEIITGLTSANWKLRLEAVQSLSAKVDNVDTAVNIQVVVQLLSRKPGWKDNNAQVLNEKFGIVEKLSKKGDVFTKRSADYALDGLVEKIGDIKLNKQSCATLTSIAEAISLNFTSANAFTYAEKQKSPKVHTEICKWLDNALTEFGMRINIKSHLTFLKVCVGSPNAQIRGAALNLIGTMSMYSGPVIQAAFADVENKNTLSQIEATIEKFKSSKPPAPSRGLCPADENGDGEVEVDGADDYSAGGGIDLEDLLERKDISSELDALCSKLDSTVWQERSEALDDAERQLKDANINPVLGSDFRASLKARLVDKNAAVKTKAIGFMSTLGKALGPGTKKFKELLVFILPMLGDGKKHVQAQTLDALNIWIEHVTIRPLLAGEDLVDALSDTNPNIRICLFSWLAEQIKATTVPPKLPKELNLIIPGLYKSLEDRNPEVRKSAQACLPCVMAHVGNAVMMDKLTAVEQKSKKTIQDLLDKFKEEADAMAPKKPQSKAKAQPKAEQQAKKSAPDSLKGSGVDEIDSGDGGSGPKKAAKKVLGKKAGAGGGDQPAAKKKKGEEEEDTDTPLKSNDKKQQRFKDENSLKLLKWNFKVPRQEYFDQLQELMEPICSPTLFGKLFHQDFKQHIEALKILISIIPTHLPEIKQSLDLLLKWISLRFFDTNTSVLLASLDWLSKCFTKLREDGYMLVEQEASAFMPYLVIKLGDSKEPVRKSVNALFNELCYIYAASRTFFHLSEGLKSKNSRQRAGVLELETKLILENGIEVCHPSPKKAFELVASFIGDKDNSVRSGALNCCVAGWNYIGNDILKWCGSLNEKDNSMLEERIKRSGKRRETPEKQKQVPNKIKQEIEVDSAVEIDSISVEMAPPREPTPPPSPPPVKKRGEFYIDYDTLIKPVTIPTHSSKPQITLDDLPDFEPPQFSFFKYSPVVMDIEGIIIGGLTELNYELVEMVGNLRHPMINVVVDTVKTLNNLLKDPQEAMQLQNYVNNLIMSAISQLSHFPTGEDERELTVYRAITSILMQTINNETLAQEISTDYIKKICKLFLAVLSDEPKTNPTIDQLVKGVNALVIRLLTNCNTGRAIAALVEHMDSLLTDTGTTKFAKELEILLKCLWKLMSRLDKECTLTPGERSEILVLLANFLRRLPSTVWKDSHDNDKPYRTVKTLVHKFCKGYELKILEDLDCLSPEDSNILRPLVESFLTALGYDLTNLVFAGTKSPTTEQEAQLMKIFDNLKDKELIRSALHELHAFITSHPSVDITPHLATLSDTKKVLVERILLDMRRNRAQLTSHANKLAIAAERQGFTFKPDLTEEHLTELKARPVMEVLKDTRNILSKHKDVFPNDAAAVDNVIVKLPKERAQATKSRLPTANINSISRPASSPSRSPARAGSQIPSTSMDDLKKRLEMIKKRSKPT